MGILGLRDLGIQTFGYSRIWGAGDLGTQKFGGTEIWGHGDFGDSVILGIQGFWD